MATALKVTVGLATPLSFKKEKVMMPIMLDSILAYWKFAEKGFKGTGNLNNPANILDADLPIEQEGGCYAASGMFIEGITVTGEDTIIRVMPNSFVAKLGSFSPNNKELNTSCGQYVSSMHKIITIHTPEVAFYARATDVDEFARLLKMFRDGGRLGGKGSIGYGQISYVRIEATENDWGLMRDGIPTRPLPVTAFRDKVNKDVPVEKVGYKPPYWHYVNQDWCFVPPVSQYMPVRDAAGSVGDIIGQRITKLQEQNAGKKKKAASE